MDAAPQPSTAEAWLHWFQQHKAPQHRMTLCTRYGLNPLDADALINAACFDVFRRWQTIDHPLTIFAITLRHQVGDYFGSRNKEQAMLLAYVEAVQQDAQHQERLAAQVAAVLATVVSPPERQLLAWFSQGVDDQGVAAVLGITPGTVRWRRHQVCQRLRQPHSV